MTTTTITIHSDSLLCVFFLIQLMTTNLFIVQIMHCTDRNNTRRFDHLFLSYETIHFIYAIENCSHLTYVLFSSKMDNYKKKNKMKKKKNKRNNYFTLIPK